MSSRKRPLLGLAALLAVALGPGCSGDALAPHAERTGRDGGAASLPDASGGTLINVDLDTFEDVTTETVRPGKETVVQGSRYALEFMENSLSKQTTITIQERHPYIVDVVLGPDGARFADPVYFTIDYEKTANDPDEPYWHGKPVELFWQNEEKGIWERVPGWDDPKEKTYTVLLFHFSRYAMHDGTGGWEGPTRGGPRRGKSDIDTP